MSAKISAIILFYNGVAYLPECVTSVLNQTYANLEVILVDDGSTDASSRQAEEFRQRPDSLSARQNSTKIFTLVAVEKWIATLALLGLDVAPEIEAYRLRLLSHRSKMELHNAQDVVTYKTVCHTLKMLDKYCPGAKI